MTLPLSSWVVTVQMQDDALALNRAIGIVRRRNLAVSGVSLGPSSRIGVARLAAIVAADEASVQRMANQLRKMVGVLEVLVTSEAECLAREHALVRVRVPAADLAALLDVVELYQGRIIEESGSELVLEATAAPATLVSLLRALEPFGVLEVVRGGTIALPRANAETAVGRAPLAVPGIARAIPA